MNHDQIRDIIRIILNDLGVKYASEKAVDLVFWTGYVESRYEYLKQIGTGPARSFWQVEPETAVSQCANYIKYRKALAARCANVTGTILSDWLNPNEERWDKILMVNVAAGIVHCRLKYWRVPKPLPINIFEAAKMWKKYYNAGGSGTVDKFRDMVGSI